MAHEHCHCRDYTRSQLLRGAAAEAGRGLPAIETGMPEPAGTGLNRRTLLLKGAGLALAVYGAGKLPLRAFEEGIADAATPNKVLVSMFFDGGIDALNVLAPINNGTYHDLRPTIGLDSGLDMSGSLHDTLFWHPSAAGLKQLHDEGKVSVLPAIGYDHADQSHFTSRHFYEIGEVKVGANTGWLGRYIDRFGTANNPLQGVSLDGSLSPMLATASKPVAAVESLPYSLWSWAQDNGAIEKRMYDTFRGFGQHGSDSAGMTQSRNAIYQTARLREQLSGFDEVTPPVPYPDNYLGQQLSGLAALLAAGLPIQCVTVSAVGGYDTHSDEITDLADNLQGTSDAVLAFQRDLESRGLQDRVLMEMWSEFGRRPEENGGGTDHGAAGLAFVVGSKSTGKTIGAPPSLSSLDEDDNLVKTSDFRSMYVTLLDKWLGVDPGPIIPGAGSFASYDLIKP